MRRRSFLKALGSAAAVGSRASAQTRRGKQMQERPNLVFVFADQWRAQATGYAGNADVKTPRLDKLAAGCANFKYAVSNCPVCSPFRASLITGRYPLTHGLFLNDLRLNREAVSIADAYNEAGYETAYIGKWHVDGTGRSAYIPPERRQGFKFWKVLECTHNYNKSPYYEGDSNVRKTWPDYDAYAQTDDAVAYINKRGGDRKPFCLFLSWGPPHAPYRTGPKELIAKYDKVKLKLRGNVPSDQARAARKDLAGYYAHCTAVDQCVGKLLEALSTTGLEENTLFVFTSDHGDMLHSRGQMKKQRPWDESIRIPFLLRCPTAWAVDPAVIDEPFGTPDMMPTLLALSGIEIPKTVEGEDYSNLVLGKRPARDRPVLIMCPSPFGQWTRRGGGREYRGVRTRRYTYARDVNGPWLLYDNEKDPCQQDNLVNRPEFTELQLRLEKDLQALLKKTGDAFLPGPELIKRCRYRVNATGTVGYNDSASFGQVSVNCSAPTS